MRKIFAYIFFICISSVFPQNIYVCSSFTENGEPIGTSPQITIYPHQMNSYYILYRNPYSFSKNESLFLFIDKIDGEHLIAFDSEVITAEKGKSWIAYNYSFKEAGRYKIYIADNRKELASIVITIWEASKSDFESTFAESFYYANAKVIFCKKVFLEKPIEPFNLRSISKDGSNFFIFLENNKPLNTNLVIIQVWLKKNNSVEYDEYVTTKRYFVNKDWKYTFFDFNLENTGDYKFILFNEKEILIKSAYITIIK
ncbi:hypothetical protein ABRY23_13910 [Melioribacteraceae bacterium 4301-Me]|uniref:hypothetical protein n=1 Tax=Pyranulibacter aquaticus TaxID=3163344 RepID=UPI0035967055